MTPTPSLTDAPFLTAADLEADRALPLDGPPLSLHGLPLDVVAARIPALPDPELARLMLLATRLPVPRLLALARSPALGPLVDRLAVATGQPRSLVATRLKLGVPLDGFVLPDPVRRALPFAVAVDDGHGGVPGPLRVRDLTTGLSSPVDLDGVSALDLALVADVVLRRFPFVGPYSDPQGDGPQGDGLQEPNP